MSRAERFGQVKESGNNSSATALTYFQFHKFGNQEMRAKYQQLYNEMKTQLQNTLGTKGVKLVLTEWFNNEPIGR